MTSFSLSYHLIYQIFSIREALERTILIPVIIRWSLSFPTHLQLNLNHQTHLNPSCQATRKQPKIHFIIVTVRRVLTAIKITLSPLHLALPSKYTLVAIVHIEMIDYCPIIRHKHRLTWLTVKLTIKDHIRPNWVTRSPPVAPPVTPVLQKSMAHVTQWSLITLSTFTVFSQIFLVMQFLPMNVKFSIVVTLVIQE